jgi:hypothetical protein
MPRCAITSERDCAGHPAARTPRTARQYAGSGFARHQGSAGAANVGGAVGSGCAEGTLVAQTTAQVTPRHKDMILRMIGLPLHVVLVLFAGRRCYFTLLWWLLSAIEQLNA